MYSKRFEKETFKEAVRENVRTLYRKNIAEASPQQIFQAVSYAVKDIIMDNWIATQKAYDEADAKTVYYMSMEFLMGRALGNNLINMTAYKEVKEALEEMDIDLNVVEAVSYTHLDVYKRQVLVFAGISTIFMVLAPFVIGEITTTLFASIQDGRFYWKTIGTLLLILIGLYFISQIFSLLQGFGMAKITAGVMETLRQDIDDKMHRLKLEYYDTHTHGDILSVITNDVDTINNTMSQNLTAIVTQAVTAAGIFLMMVSISPKLSVIPIILVPLSLLSAAKMMKLSGTYYNRQQQLLGTLNGYIEEIYHGHQVVQTFHYQKRAQAAFEELNRCV